MRVHVGTSGWNYPEWRGTFYPEKFAANRMFGFYAERFTTVEVNATFYRMPTDAMAAAWLAQAPAGFAYTLKAPRRITHDARLEDCADLVRIFSDTAKVLGRHLGTLLFQLPPTFRADVRRLADFLQSVPPDVRTAFEFRHDAWLTDEVYQVLADHRAALCIADFGDKTTPTVVTAEHGYFRLRDEGYTPADFETWAAVLEQHAHRWTDVFVYFKHEDQGKGPEFARRFKDVLTRRGVTLA
jgi:uncharacterized protein YecE (DUF72 family)